jgi:phage baseplate assembly protein W
MALKPSRSYKDLSFTFSKNPLTKDLVLLKNDNAIKRALLNLFSFKKGEKFFNGRFGSGIPDLLFEPFDYATAGMIKDQVINLVNSYEPRVNILDIIVNLNDDEYTYDIQIEYSIPDSSPQVNSVNLSLSSSSKV